MQGHFHLDKSIVPWIESLITTQCVLFCPYVGYLSFWKIKVWLLFHCKSSIVILSIYICTLFNFKIEKNKKERQGNKKNNNLILSKMILVGLELLTPGSTGQCANHCATKIKTWACICPIYRQPIFIINFNTDKTVSTQSELLAFLPTL